MEGDWQSTHTGQSSTISLKQSRTRRVGGKWSIEGA